MVIGKVQFTAVLVPFLLSFYNDGHLMVASIGLHAIVTSLDQMDGLVAQLSFLHLVHRGIRVFPQKPRHLPVSQFIGILAVASWNLQSQLNPVRIDSFTPSHARVIFV